MNKAPAFAAGIVLLLAGVGNSQTLLQLQRGWGGKERTGRWNPVILRAKSPLPRDVTLQLISAGAGGFAAVTHEHVAIGPNQSTFEMFAPSHYSPWESGVLVLRDAQSDRLISQFPQHILHVPHSAEVGPQGVFIGITGQSTLLNSVVQSGVASAAYLPPRLLPQTVIGYDCLDVLLLNQPDMSELDVDQQRAILDWVRAGGSVLFIPPDGPLPTKSPLADALPCHIGQITPINLGPGEIKQAGLTAHFARLTGRVLNAASSRARSVTLLPGDHATAWTVRYGLGRILVSPIDLSALEFEPANAAQKASEFWNPILSELADTPLSLPRRKFDAPYYGYQSESEDQQREGAAVGVLCDFIGAGSDPRTRPMPVALLAILLIIGPVDSVLLFALGRRPWTLITSAGWVGLMISLAMFGTSALRQGRAEYRSVRMIDQVGDVPVASADLVSLFSESGGTYSLEPSAPDRPGWWEPIVPGIIAADEIHSQTDAEFHQTDSGDIPQTQVIEPGQVRFFRADAGQPGLAIIAASFSLSELERNPPHLLGTIKNRSDHPLQDVRIRTRHGVVMLQTRAGRTIGAGQTVAVDRAAAGEPFTPAKWEDRYQSYGYFGSHHAREPVNETDLWAIAPDLSARRSARIDELIERHPDFACVYAESLDPAATATLHVGGRINQRHYQWVRALVPLTP